jgi:phage repressor protein C with HTH and peptisase S24 domain
MTHPVPTSDHENGPFRTGEEQYFWKALADLATMENAPQGALAAFVGVSQGYVSKILAGKQTPKPALRRRFAAFSSCPTRKWWPWAGIGWRPPTTTRKIWPAAGAVSVREPLYGAVSNGPDHAALRTMLRDIRAREAHQLYYTEVPLREATGSMGGGSTETGSRALSYLSFRTEWIRSKGNPENMTVIRAFGDSMDPTIVDGSVVLVDEGRRHFVRNKIYYLRYNGQMYIKRLVERDGQMAIVSDNDPNIYLVSDADDFEIIGRCIWAARELD